jgi:hypothetical protein
VRKDNGVVRFQVLMSVSKIIALFWDVGAL